jgi:hypothetical protein
MLRASAIVAMIAGGSHLGDQQVASAQARAGGAAEDPCRFATADVVSKAFGRQLQSSRLTGVCQYKGPAGELVVVQVKAGPEGTIVRHLRTTTAQGNKFGAEKLASKIGEAYYDSVAPVFAGRVGNYDVQVGTTMEPVPRAALIAVGTRILESLAGK